MSNQKNVSIIDPDADPKVGEERLMSARCRVQITHPWYGAFTSQFRWISEEAVGTMGVCIKRGGVVHCYYNPKLCASLSIDELIAVICHEVEHIVRMHCQRTPSDANQPDKHLYNIAQDWIINGPNKQKHIPNLPDFGEFMPKPGSSTDDRLDRWKGSDLSFFKDDRSSEEVFHWIKNNTKEVQWGKGKGKSSGGSGGGQDEEDEDQGQGQDGYTIKTSGDFDLMNVQLTDDHSMWDRSDASREEIRQTAKDMADRATRTAGNTPGHLEEAITALAKPEVNWRHYVRNLIGTHIANKKETYNKANRRRRQFGIKGHTRHTGAKLNVMVDTSGSVSSRMLEKFFAEIESVSQYCKIKLIEFDHEVQQVRDYHSGDWKSINVKGRGGTSFINALDYLEEEGLVSGMQIILTDGEAGIPEDRGYYILWVVIGRDRFEYFKRTNYPGDAICISDTSDD